MTTRTAVKTKWIPGTHMSRQAAPLPVVNKPYTAPDDATLVQLIECYGYLIMRPNGWMWLTGLVPKHQRQIVADRIRAKLLEAKGQGRPGRFLVTC